MHYGIGVRMNRHINGTKYKGYKQTLTYKGN